jgi:8-oxo-dGTP pyrophosphatase MutT (NUDIX family)
MTSVVRTLVQDASNRPIEGVVAVILQADRFLVIRRSQFVRAPRQFCFPGGEILAGEDQVSALVRELREELAVSIQPLRLLWNSVTPWGVSLAWWHAALPEEAILTPNSQEVESVHWLRAEEMLDLPDLLESNREFLLTHSLANIRGADVGQKNGRQEDPGQEKTDDAT